MPKVAGITVERRYKRPLPIVSIDLNKHREFIPMLEDKGVEIDKTPNKETKKAINEARNSKKMKTYSSADELFKHWENDL